MQEKKSWLRRHPTLIGVLIILVLIIVISSITHRNKEPSSNAVNNQQSSISEGKSSLGSQKSPTPTSSTSPSNSQRSSTSPSTCEQFSEDHYKAKCYYDIALEKNDGSLCSPACAWDDSPYLNEGYCWDCKVKFNQLGGCEEKCTQSSYCGADWCYYNGSNKAFSNKDEAYLDCYSECKET